MSISKKKKKKAFYFWLQALVKLIKQRENIILDET